ncbi:bacteriocin immunity protein [Pseudomonas cichorii]|uniref:bacteriocin immunity protein n=1 Tax=Pseudomonas cichorii TaxID=36746 RepID=UPI001C8AD98B|nr:bacteriocin immunity protein [Pseudomonas cichorii]MBX8577208.1 bacteriocin immunity protein [Pseudomonas cichorii]
MIIKSKFEEYTEHEFLEFLKVLFAPPGDLTKDEFDRRTLQLIEHFEQVSEHPACSDLIFYPEADQEDSPEGVLKSVKEWREKNGKPGFKATENNNDQPHH